PSAPRRKISAPAARAPRAADLDAQAADAANSTWSIDMKLSTLPTAVAVATLVLAAVAATPTHAQMKEQTVTVGGAPMYPSKNIIQNAMNSKDHTTLVAAVKAAGLVETLQGSGPFTVFAPTNTPVAELPAVPRRLAERVSGSGERHVGKRGARDRGRRSSPP